MNASSLSETVLLGALTGMRSMAGPAVVAHRYGKFTGLMSLMTLGEMIADKIPSIPNRIDRLPLTARAVIGALIGGVIASEHRHNRVLGGLLGASAAVIAAHLVFRARSRAPIDTATSGVVEDAIVLGIGSWYASRA